MTYGMSKNCFAHRDAQCRCWVQYRLSAVKMLDFEVKKGYEKQVFLYINECFVGPCCQDTSALNHIKSNTIWIKTKFSQVSKSRFSFHELRSSWMVRRWVDGSWKWEIASLKRWGPRYARCQTAVFFWMFRKWYAPDSRWEQLSIDSIGLYKSYILYVYIIYIYIDGKFGMWELL